MLPLPCNTIWCSCYDLNLCRQCRQSRLQVEWAVIFTGQVLWVMSLQKRVWKLKQHALVLILNWSRFAFCTAMKSFHQIYQGIMATDITVALATNRNACSCSIHAWNRLTSSYLCRVLAGKLCQQLWPQNGIIYHHTLNSHADATCLAVHLSRIQGQLFPEAHKSWFIQRFVLYLHGHPWHIQLTPRCFLNYWNALCWESTQEAAQCSDTRH